MSSVNICVLVNDGAIGFSFVHAKKKNVVQINSRDKILKVFISSSLGLINI